MAGERGTTLEAGCGDPAAGPYFDPSADVEWVWETEDWVGAA
jgi:hypothetical protein